MRYLRQLLAGRDFAVVNPAAGQMANFVYLVGDKEAGECYVVDPAWDVRGLLDVAAADGVKVVGAIATHAHPDHVGGTIMGFTIEGVARLVELAGVKVWVHEADAAQLRRGTGLAETDVVTVKGGDTLVVGGETIEIVHTPGHTPGGMCLKVGDALLTGDTLFVGACGRVDLPGSDPKQMYQSLTVTLRALPDDTVVYPGHDYGRAPTSTLGDEKRKNAFMQPGRFDDWDALE